jgi:hypothetical protein
VNGECHLGVSKRTEEPKEPRNRTGTVPEPDRILEPWYGSWFLKFQILGSRDGSGRNRPVPVLSRKNRLL